MSSDPEGPSDSARATPQTLPLSWKKEGLKDLETCPVPWSTGQTTAANGTAQYTVIRTKRPESLSLLHQPFCWVPQADYFTQKCLRPQRSGVCMANWISAFHTHCTPEFPQQSTKANKLSNRLLTSGSIRDPRAEAWNLCI